MAYRFNDLDILDIQRFAEIPVDAKLTLSVLPLMAVFINNRQQILPMSVEAVTVMLRADHELLERLGLRKSELLLARNAFIRFEQDEELFEDEARYAA